MKISKKEVRCPLCSARIMDEREDVECEVVILVEGNSRRGWNSDFFVKCHKCKREVGIRKLL